MNPLLQKIQQRIRDLEGLGHLECWLEEIRLSEDAAGNLVVNCPNSFTVERLSGRHRGTLASLFEEEIGRNVNLTFRVTPSPAPGPRPIVPLGRTARPTPPDGKAAPAGAREPASPEGPFPEWNPRYRFSTFVTGRSNGFAWAAAQEVCRGFRFEYNPLLLHASTGLGKTHLGQAIAHRVFRENPNLRVRWATAEGFFAEMIRHVRDKTIFAFKKRYREECDLFVLDDIQFLKEKKALQSELCHTLDVLLNRGVRVVLLGNLRPKDRQGLDENLASRIFSGLSVSIDPPDYETRFAILSRFAHASGLPLPDETIAAVARRVRSHVRDLEGAFGRLAALHRFSRRPPRPEEVERLFEGLHPATHPPLNHRTIKEHVARYFGLDPEVLSSRSRKRRILYPRQIGMYLARKYTCESLESIGALYDRDHASVLHAVRSLERKMAAQPRVAREVEFIEQKLLSPEG